MSVKAAMFDEKDARLAGTSILTGAGIFVISMVYNHFGHGVHSRFMDLAFLIPLAGAVWYMILAMMKVKVVKLSENLTFAGLSALTAGSLLKGILEIANTGSVYIRWFFLAGMVLCIMAFVSQIIQSQDSH
ncbi:MAG: hypothetical protein VZT48_06125 [Bulleidia sp.]|nr:hypothetical protein [Bulleidia sp.]